MLGQVIQHAARIVRIAANNIVKAPNTEPGNVLEVELLLLKISACQILTRLPELQNTNRQVVVKQSIVAKQTTSLSAMTVSVLRKHTNGMETKTALMVKMS